MPVLKKELVDYLLKKYSLNIKQACSLLQYNRSSYYYLKKEKTDSLVIGKLTQLAQDHPTYGFWKMYKIIRRLGYLWNHKRVYRIYKLLKNEFKQKSKKTTSLQNKNSVGSS